MTTAAGSVQILFVDKTSMTIGPNSDLTIDEYVYDPNAGSGKLAATLGKEARIVTTLERDSFILAGYLAARLPDMHFGFSVVSVPLHHPVRFTERVNVLDHLTKGKLLVGLTRCDDLSVQDHCWIAAYDTANGKLLWKTLTIADKGTRFDLKPDFGKSVVTALTRINGHSTGVIANNPLFKGGALDVDACNKVTSFLVLCDSFNIPIVFLVDVPGFLIGLEGEQRGAPGQEAKKGAS